jgi:hypothetical protein
MGREIRRVPANWEHPKEECHSHRPPCYGGVHYHPMHDEDFETRLNEWLEGYEKWKKGEHEAQKESWTEGLPYWEYDGPPPNPYYYHPKWESAEWYQMYETVSEGTPVTPPFATKEELINYLVEHGDFWDQHRGAGGWDRANAEHFVGSGWAPSMVTVVSPDSVEIKTPRDGI